MLVAVSTWVIRQLELFTPLSHNVLVFTASAATWWYNLPLGFLILPGMLLVGEWLWFALMFVVLFQYWKQTKALRKLFEDERKRAEHAEQAKKERFLFRLLPLANMVVFTYAARTLAGNRDMKGDYDLFVILAIASFIVLCYELLACVGPIRKRRSETN